MVVELMNPTAHSWPADGRDHQHRPEHLDQLRHFDAAPLSGTENVLPTALATCLIRGGLRGIEDRQYVTRR